MSKSNYYKKQEARKERYEELAKKNEQLSNELHKQSSKMAELIPMGQPLMPDHYSYKRDKAYREKIWNKLGQAVKASEKAEYYEDKASSVGTGGISSDDPEVITKLKEKLNKLEKRQEFHKTVNKIVKSEKLSHEQKIDELIKLDLSSETANKLFEPDFAGRIGIPDYEITNNGAEIRRLKQRIEIETKKAQDITTEFEINDIRIVDNVEENRIQIFFPAIPSEKIRTKLKSSGFKWSRFNGCWQRFRNNYRLKMIIEYLKEA